jgi:hypothetical protein
VRYLMSGTPIKNRLESLFWLMHWACGSSPDPTPRFPYAATSDAREQFANQHLQHDQFLTREEEAEAAWRLKHGKSRRFKIEFPWSPKNTSLPQSGGCSPTQFTTMKGTICPFSRNGFSRFPRGYGIKLRALYPQKLSTSPATVHLRSGIARK